LEVEGARAPVPRTWLRQWAARSATERLARLVNGRRDDIAETDAFVAAAALIDPTDTGAQSAGLVA